MLSKKNILIFGGSGFIGSNFINSLKGYNKIINYDKLTYASKIFKQHTSNKKNLSFYKKDICKSKDIHNVLEKYKPTIIVNFAAETHVDNSIDDSESFINTNIKGVLSILTAIKNYKSKNKNNKIKLIHISTDEVFGEILYGNANEKSCYKPSSPYSSSKASGDLLIKSFGRTFGIEYNIIYSTNNYGPSQNFEKFIPKSIISFLNKKKMEVYGQGTQRRDWIHVNDFCRAINKVIAKKSTKYNEFCVSSGKTYSNINVLKLIIKILYKQNLISNKTFSNFIINVRDRPGHDKRYAMSHILIKDYLNWQPQETLEKGLEKTINWYIKYNKILIKKNNLANILKRKG